MAIRGVTFDIGGTLIKPSPNEAETFVEVAGEYGYDISLDMALAGVDKCWELYHHEYAKNGDFWCTHEGCEWIWHAQYEVLCDACGVVAHKAEIVEGIYESFLHAHHWKAFPDVLPLLEELRSAGIRMGVVSNWDISLEGLLAEIGLGQYFDVVLASGAVGLRKPDVRIFSAAACALDIPPEELLHVGDLDPEDGFAPMQAGFHSVIIDRKNVVHDPSLQVIKDLSDLRTFLA